MGAHGIRSPSRRITGAFRPDVALRIIPTDGRGVRGGRTFGAKEGGRISIHVGKETTLRGLNSDWMLTHEMVHSLVPFNGG